MPSSRDLKTNSLKAVRQADGIIAFTSKELIDSYKTALVEVRSKVAQLYETFLTVAEPTKAQLTQFMRLSGIEKEIVTIMRPYLTQNEALIKDMSMLGIDTGYFNSAWAIDQASGVSLNWSMISDNAVRAAAGLGGGIGNLTGLMTDYEVKQHQKLLDDAFVNYDKDTVKWIGRDIRTGIIQGDSVQTISKRLRDNALTSSYNSAMKITRTEVLRATGLGQQIGYDEARDFGVNVNEVWDATLDSRTRPEHGASDGLVKDNVTGFFDVAWGQVAGPRRSGIAGQDINCRCFAVGEVEGYSPELRRIRGEGLQPYQTFETWATKKGITANKYGQKYNFKGAA